MSGWLLDGNADVNAHGGEYGSTLQAVSAHGHEAVIQLLLEKDTDINVQGVEESYGSALYVVSAGWSRGSCLADKKA